MAKSPSHVMRDPSWIAIKKKSTYYFVQNENRIEIQTVHITELSSLLDLLTAPVAQKKIDALLSRLQKTVPLSETKEWLKQLREAKILLSGSEPQLLKKLEGFIAFAPDEKFCKHLVICIAGSIQSSNITSALQKLITTFAEKVDLVVTESAAKFFNSEVFVRAGIRVWRHMTDSHGDMRVPHVQLARSADLVVVFPASAASLSRIAHGSCSDLLSTIAIGTRAPVVLLPAMNTAMWSSAAVSRNIDTLVKDGFYIVHPGPGIALADTDKLTVEVSGMGINIEQLDHLPYLLMQIMSIHDERP